MKRPRLQEDIEMSEEKKSSPLMIALAWLIVSIPAAWGVYNTVLNAMKLFH